MTTWQEQISQLIEARTGLVLSESTKQRLGGFVAKRCAALSLTTPEQYVRVLEAQQLSTEFQEIVNTVTVSKTSFFRYPKHVDAICQHLLPTLDRVLEAKRPIHIWCAAVSSGEEPYTLAMALDHAGWFARRSITLFGTDINDVSLARARRAEYHLDPATRERMPQYAWKYLELDADEKRFRVAEQTRARVEFAHANLNALAIRADVAWHIVLCCNVLIYFEEANRRRVISEMQARMAEHSALLLGGAEITVATDPAYRVRDIAGCFAHLRGNWPGLPSSDFNEPAAASPQISEAAPEIAQPIEASERKLAPRPERIEPLLPTRTALPVEEGAARLPVGAGSASPATPSPAAELSRWRPEARAFLDAKQFEEARKVLEAVREQDPFCEDAHFLCGQALRALGRRDEAESAFRRVLFLDPDFALARFEFGLLRHLQSDFAGAVREYQRTLGSLSNRTMREPKVSASLAAEEARAVEKFMERVCAQNLELALAGLLPEARPNAT